jgi:cytochrome c553
MTPTKRFLAVLLGAGLAFGAGTALAQQKDQKDGTSAQKTPPAGGEHAKANVAMCIGCHGIPGYKTAFPLVYHVPMIAGQQPGYIVNALKAYKSGERSHPSMRGIAASLTDEEMAQLAAYYGAQAK